jgi:N-methylhydantoinase A
MTTEGQEVAGNRWRVGVDVGGTFTDVAVFDQTTSQLRVLKVPTTPSDPSVGVIDGLDVAEQRIEGFRAEDIGDFLHGTTITTNALIQRTFRPCALLVSEGLKGSVFVQDQRRVGNLYDLRAGHPASLVADDQVYEVPERVSADGLVVRPLDRARLLEIANRIQASGIEAIAVCLLFSFANPMHELQVRETLLSVCPDLRVHLSSEVLPRIREWPRISTMLLGCSLEPLLVKYLSALERGLVNRGLASNRLFLMESNGGLMPFAAVTDGGRAVHTLLSGPAAGVQAAISIARAAGRDHLLTMDVGGTSADIAFVQKGKALEITEGELVGHQIYVPMLDLVTVGAGGGTLCRGSDEGRLLVGPNSAGADPGPASYGKGGQVATITDANLILGLLNPDFYLGGRMTLDTDAAQVAVRTSLARPLDLDDAVAASSAKELNEVHMADTIKVLAAQRGVDLGGVTLVACGGAGPLHACGVADEIGIRSVLVPAFPGAFSAVGLLGSDVVQDFVQTVITGLAERNEPEIEKQFAALEERARSSLVGQGFLGDDVVLRREIDARYAGQGFELRLLIESCEQLSATLLSEFHDEHERVYGHAARDESVEIVSYRVRAVVKMPTLDFGRSTGNEAEIDRSRTRRSVFCAGRWAESEVVHRAALRTGETIAGPVIVQQADTTTFVAPGWTLGTDEVGNLILTKESTGD